MDFWHFFVTYQFSKTFHLHNLSCWSLSFFSFSWTLLGIRLSQEGPPILPLIDVHFVVFILLSFFDKSDRHSDCNVSGNNLDFFLRLTRLAVFQGKFKFLRAQNFGKKIHINQVSILKSPQKTTNVFNTISQTELLIWDVQKVGITI